ncbi:UPF0764 protein C16orf89-like [Babylonia areolata]|uniref:UPF0764 protein C16orf89-like n=1 Tax=Babylonia areolata TaxID=304850 RepID=UPI003FCF1578
MGSNRITNTSTPSSSSSFLPLVLLVLLVPPVVQGRARGVKVAAEGTEARKMLEDMVAAVERTLAFFSEDYASINVDGLFGIRVAQGQILEAQKECQGSGSCPEDLQRRLQAIVDQFDTAAEAALSYVKEEDPQYFRRFLQVIDRPFLLPYRQKTLQDLSKTPVGDDSSYDEETGDECLSRIMGAFVEESSGKKIEECNVTRSCWDMMTDKGRCKYSITHQLLYFSFIEKSAADSGVRMLVNEWAVAAQCCGTAREALGTTCCTADRRTADFTLQTGLTV